MPSRPISPECTPSSEGRASVFVPIGALTGAAPSEPRHAFAKEAPLDRREFLRLMGATLALAGAAGCVFTPEEKIVPYVEQPDVLVPGKPLSYATAFQRDGYAYGVLVESHMGRPVKIEGNPDHPASLGATDVFGQGSLWTLYDPHRLQTPRFLGDPSTWDAFLRSLVPLRAEWRRTGGAGLRLLVGPFTSPTLARQLAALLDRYPRARVYGHDPVPRDGVRDGTRLAFGREAQPIYRIDRATVLLTLDSDFLLEEPGHLRYARDFSEGRRVRADRLVMNRLYAIESTMTITGASADHRLALRPSQIETAAREIAAALGVAGVAPPVDRVLPPEWRRAVVDDLRAAGPSALVLPGLTQPGVVHALAHAINQTLGSLGRTVQFIAPVSPVPGGAPRPLAELVAEMRAGVVGTLVIVGSNPVYTTSPELAFADALQHVPLRIRLGLYDDETGVLCHWHLAESHYLEAWSDARAYDGLASIVQPLIVPLYATRSAHELIGALIGDLRPASDIVRETWRGRLGTGEEAERAWNAALQRGFLPGTAATPARCRFAARSHLPRHRPRPNTSSASDPIRRSGMVSSPTTPGSRSCPSR